MNTIQEAIRELRNQNTLNEARKDKRSNTLVDLWDQVYCSLTDGGYNNTYAALGKLNGKNKYPVTQVQTLIDVRPGVNGIRVTSSETEEAEHVAKVYGLEYHVAPNKWVEIYIPDGAPVKTEFLTPEWRDKFETDAEEETDVYEELALQEDVASTIPAQPLPTEEVRRFILDLPEPSPNMPPRFFKLGYIKELEREIPSKYKGGRGSIDKETGEQLPFVRIFKCTEYSALYTGSDWKDTNATKAADKVLGTERHTGEKTGFGYSGEGDVVNRIGTYRDGSEALQAYIADHSKQKVKYFISLNDEDLHEASREEIAEYLTPAAANKILNSVRTSAGIDAEGNEIYDKPINRFKLKNIYMIGNLGHSVIR